MVNPLDTKQPQFPLDRGERMEWREMPQRVRREVDRWLGSPVVNAVTQPTGFSPGVAARLITSDGHRVFAKAVGAEPNPVSPTMHRREIEISAALLDTALVPRLLWSHDEGDGGWVVLLFEDVDGRHPTQPWQLDELHRVIAAMEELAATLTPSPLSADLIGTAGDAFSTAINSWQKLRDQHPAMLGRVDEWSLRNLDTLVSVERTVGDVLEGDTLLNLDMRGDNVLLTQDQIWFVDWPHARVGPDWLDVVAFAPSVAMQGGPAPEEVISRHFACRAADSEAISAAVVAIAGYFTYQALQPPPPGLPTIRAFQDAQGVVAREWAAQLTGLS